MIFYYISDAISGASFTRARATYLGYVITDETLIPIVVVVIFHVGDSATG